MNGFVVPKNDYCWFLTKGKIYEVVKFERGKYSCGKSDVKVYFYDDVDDLIWVWLNGSCYDCDVYFQIPYNI